LHARKLTELEIMPHSPGASSTAGGSQTLGGKSSMGGTGMPKVNKPTQMFMGRQQPSRSRVPENPPVNYAKGGDDFRCPRNGTSSFGRQITSFKHTNRAPVVAFTQGPKFVSAESIGIGPNSLGQMSSMGRQMLSNRRAEGACTFGTSTRNGALKLYAIYTCKKN